MRLKAVLLRERGAVVGHGERQEVVLDVGIGHARTAADEAAGLEVVGRAESVMAQQPTHADHRAREESHGRIERDWLGARDLEVELNVVLQVLADARPVRDDVDAVLVQFRCGPDAGELQELRSS